MQSSEISLKPILRETIIPSAEILDQVKVYY